MKDGTKEYVRVKRYNCKSCGKGSQVEFKDEFKKYSGLPAKLDKIIFVPVGDFYWKKDNQLYKPPPPK